MALKPTLDERQPLDAADATTVTASQQPQRRSWSPPAPGTKVGRYEVRAPLGAGGMGTVVAAWDPELARPVALKFVGKVGTQGDEQERLLREAQAMAQLRHPNAVPVYDVGSFEGRVFLAMELIDGVTLKQWCEQKPRAPHQVVDLLCQVGAALSAAHAAGIVHRDVKPANVLVDKDGRARISDFGVARIKDNPDTPSTVKGPISDDTAAGVVVGTVGYLAPETMYGDLATPAVDQYALAVTAWQLLTGVLPFPQVVDAKLAEALTHDRLEPQEAHRVPRRLRKVLRRALRGDQARRYRSVQDFCDALTPAPPTSRRWWAVRIGAALVLVPVYLSFLAFGLTRFALGSVISACRSRALHASFEEWSPERQVRFLLAHGEPATLVAQAYVARWRDASLGACFTSDINQKPTRVVRAQQDCLDEKLRRFGAQLAALDTSPGDDAEVAQRLLSLEDPRGCVADWSGESGTAAPWPPRASR